MKINCCKKCYEELASKSLKLAEKWIELCEFAELDQGTAMFHQPPEDEHKFVLEKFVDSSFSTTSLERVGACVSYEHGKNNLLVKVKGREVDEDGEVKICFTDSHRFKRKKKGESSTTLPRQSWYKHDQLR